ncbi:PRC-barrel domain-containing protein [Streptacidiphilus cavernicola]|uniref:PRC-barrel domain-containing protein n=1 Tax=Streptacidiphilus cavernicola TaxID=3342716 RepID=A0ABV6VWN8_9ACTN
MSDTGAETRYAIGAEVRCTDGPCGRMDRVVVDPVAGRLTHLVVDPGHGTRRLVPVELVDETGAGRGGGADRAGHGSHWDGAGELRLRCDRIAFEALEPAEETGFLPAGEEHLGYGPEQIIVWPYYGLGPGAVTGAIGMGAPGVAAAPGGPRATTYDRVPSGEVQIRRGERVEATDGEIGRVQGLVIDPRDHGVTHVLLQEGHLWGKKTVAVPIGTVSYVGGSVLVDLSKAELGDLPPVDVAL